MNFGRFLKLCTNETKNIFTIHFYNLFIDILRLNKKLTEKLKIHKVMSWQRGGPKKECSGVHNFNPSGHLKQKAERILN